MKHIYDASMGRKVIIQLSNVEECRLSVKKISGMNEDCRFCCKFTYYINKLIYEIGGSY